MIYDTDIYDPEREFYSQRFACDECGDIHPVLDAGFTYPVDGTICFRCWELSYQDTGAL